MGERGVGECGVGRGDGVVRGGCHRHLCHLEQTGHSRRVHARAPDALVLHSAILEPHFDGIFPEVKFFGQFVALGPRNISFLVELLLQDLQLLLGERRAISAQLVNIVTALIVVNVVAAVRLI